MENKHIARPSASVQRIVQAAQTVFGRKGYRGASMQQIARAAGVSKSLVHYHFDGKEHLFMEAQLQMFRELLARVERLSSGGGIASDLEMAFEAVVRFVERDHEQLLVLLEFRDIMGTNPVAAARMEDFKDQVHDLVDQGLRNALGPQRAGEAIPSTRLARLLVALFQGLVVDMALSPGADGRARVREAFHDVRRLLEAWVLETPVSGHA